MCNSCNVLYINHVKCHEIGCPESWKDKKKECDNCGIEFTPEEKGQKYCSTECFNDYSGYNNPDYYCDDCNSIINQEEYFENNGLCLYCIEKKEA
jgi:hypothetical protein